jgi:monoamine oxidase
VSHTEPILDVAIVGAGVSGVYSAWRLKTFNPKLEIRVFESSRRIGGRLVSVTPPGMPHVRCELGGMRYMSTQPLIRSLVENELKLATRELPVNEPSNIAYLRGVQLRLSELTDPSKVPYDVDWAERGRDPGDLVGYAIDQLIPGVTKLRGAELWQVLKTFMFQGQHVFDQGFWNLLAQSLSREGYAFAQAAGGYDTTVLNWNAADTIVLNFDFAPDVKFKALVEGYETVPHTVADRFQKAGGVIELGARMHSFDRVTLPDGTSGVRLVFGEHPPVLARALILAMPRRSIELLDQTGAVLGPENRDVHRLVRSVTPIPLFKMVVCYHYPWWEAVGVTQGRSVTDMPIRQLYYWAVEGRQPGADPKNLNSVVMVYDDTLNVDFWSGLRDRKRQPPFRGMANLFADAYHGSEHWRDYAAPGPMVSEVQRQLIEMHGLRFAPEPYAAAYIDWGEDPYGGGVNFWNIHEKSWEVIPAIAKPKSDIPVYVTGEAYSNGQGWVEGALETAELVLQTHFHLPPPPWVTQ